MLASPKNKHKLLQKFGKRLCTAAEWEKPVKDMKTMFIHMETY